MRQHINELVVTDGEQIICVPPQPDIQLAASLGSEKSHALAMFQALTGCDTASVLKLLDMDRKLHGMPAMELIARACYTACALTDIQEHKRATLMYVQRIPPTHTALEQLGLNQICFFFYPFCFSLLLKFSTYFAFYCTHFAFNYTHDEVMLHKSAAPIPSVVLVDLSSCCSHQQ